MAEVSFGEWLKRRRKGLGLTQDQLALQINCSTSALRKFESEERRPSAETIEHLADIFNIPSEERRSFLRFARGDWQAFAGSDTEKAPWRLSTIGQQSNLPSLFTSFIGREKEQHETINLLKKNRLVTLAGAGGIGKTRLAIQVGHQMLHKYPEGVWFVQLGSLSDPLQIPHTVASVLGIREGIDRDVIETLKNVLRKKNTLLILDNCEHLLDACAQLIKTLLTDCPNLGIFTTSREILKMEGEATYFLPSLSTPELSDPPERIAEYESIQLFVDRATLALSTFKLSKENARAIADISRRVDGIPLAIELIVARVSILKVEEISRRLQTSFAILTDNNRTTLSRHQTLRSSIDWSWSLLTDSEQVFLRQLSVFTGGWTLESAQSVCDGNALTLINSLAQKSLIMVEQAREYETRYHFHEIIRQYAHEKLVESGELEAVRTRHLKYFLGLSEKIESGLLGIKQVEWFARTVDERDNLHTALEQAAKTDIEAGLYIASRLGTVWQSYDVRKGSFWLAEFLRSPESKHYSHARARALCAQGLLLVWLGKFPQARGAAKESLALFHACNDQVGEIDTLILLGATYSWLGFLVEGGKLYQQALSLSQSLGDVWRQARVYYFLGWDHPDNQGYFAYWEKAAILYREAGDQRSQVATLCDIALYRALNGDMELAQKYLNEATLVFPFDRKSDLWYGYLTAKSIIALEQGDYELAYTLQQEVLDQSEILGKQLEYLWAKVRLGHLALRMDKIHEAQVIFAETAVEFQNIYPLGVIFALEGMAEFFMVTDNLENAAQLIGLADATRKEINDRRPLLEQRKVDKVIAVCISRMGEIAFADAYDEGQLMTLDEAVTLALKDR